MKTQQSKEKASKHNGCTVFLRVSTGGIALIFYNLSSINFTPSQFHQLPFLPPPPPD